MNAAPASALRISLPCAPALCGLTLAVLAALPAQANQSLSTSGYGLTVGPVYSRANLGSAGYNPANGLRLVAPDESVRLGVAQVGVQYELGQVDDVQKTADQIKAAIDAATIANAQAQVNEVNRLLTGLDAGTRGSLQGYGSLLTPLLIRSETLRGVFALNVSAQAQAAGTFYSAPAELLRDALGTPTGKVTTASAFDVKTAQITQVSLGYSTDLLPLLTSDPGARQLDVGLRVNAYRAQLYRQMVAFVDNAGNTNNGGFDRHASRGASASATAVDLGAMWGTENYQLGATLYNLGSPRLRFPDPTFDLNIANAQAAAKLEQLGKIVTDDSVSLKPHLVLEASVFSSSKRWLAQGSLATHETPNFVGEAQRYATASVSFNAERFDGSYGTLLNYLVPSARLGYRVNLAGTGLATTGLGLSWGVVNLDFNVSQQRVNADGSKVPRTAGAALSIAEKF